MGLPGVKVGPLDPDRTAEFGTVSQRNSARQLVRLHTQAYPTALLQALALKHDEERSLALDQEEVEDYLAGLKLENGDPVVPDGCSVVGVNVRGDRDRPQKLTFTYLTPSGRTAKWFADYSEEALPDSYAEGSERVRVADLRKRGIVTTEAGAHVSSDSALQRENAKLQRKLDELQARLTRSEEEPTEPAEGDVEPGDESEDVEPEKESTEPAAAQEPPFEDYDEVHAPDLVKRLKAKGTSDEDRQAILDFERTHQNRKSVVAAAEQALGTRGSAD